MSSSPMAGLAARWLMLSEAEKLALRCLLLLLVGALVWFAGVAPALRTVSGVAGQSAKLDAQLQAVQKMATQAKALQARPPLARADAMREMQALTTQRFGVAAVLQSGTEKTVVTVKGVSSDSLVSWLAQARQNTGAVLDQANLRQLGTLWDGTLVISLPGAP